jgi:nitroreductase
MPLLPLSPDELLSTTRSVRKRLDLNRPVEREVIEECLKLAQQAPTASNTQNWHFVIVTDPAKRKALADLYVKGWTAYRTSRSFVGNVERVDPSRSATQGRVASSSEYLAEHLHEVPVHVIPCISGRTDGLSGEEQAARWGSIIQAAWSFMLAARARGLGTVWTTLHLPHEREAAEVLGIPYERVMQAALIPLAYTKGTDFKPAPRASLDSIVHWESW